MRKGKSMSVSQTDWRRLQALQVDTQSDRRRELAVVASGGVAFRAGVKLT
jgi:hypothetical protein